MKWISVKDKLPDNVDDVLIHSVDRFGNSDDIKIGFFNSGVFVLPGEILRNEVTHWMPLPEPPNS